MAKTAAQTDNFNDNSLNTTKWFTYAGGSATANEQNGQIELALPASATGADYAGLGTNNGTYDFTNSSVSMKIVSNVGSTGFWHLNVYDAAGSITTNAVQWRYEFPGVYAEQYVGGVLTSTFTGLFLYASYGWVRIREESGVVYWDSSGDGITWTNRHSASPSITKTAVEVDIQAYAAAPVSNPGTLKFDNYNLYTKEIVPTGIASAEAFGTTMVGSSVTLLPSSIASTEDFGTANLLYDKTVYPSSIDDGAIGTPAVTIALLTSTAYAQTAKPTTTHGSATKPTTAHSAVTKPTTAHSSEVV